MTEGDSPPVDPEDPVVRACAAGIEAELAGRSREALGHYQAAWEARRDDVGACIAAHYLARLQADPADRLAWNRRALRHARRDAAAAPFLPSLLLNLGAAYEAVGHAAAALGCLREAERRLAAEPTGLDATVADGVERALARLRDGDAMRSGPPGRDGPAVQPSGASPATRHST